jgi:hypothetical protein
MLTREFNAVRLNQIVNHPDVFPHVAGQIDGPLDLSPLTDDRRNVALVGEHGALLFHMRQPGLYEVHTCVVPEGRGRWALAAAREALRWMFVRTDCLEVITRVPLGNVAATALTRACWLSPIVTIPQGWNGADCTVHGLTIQDWLKHDQTLRERGQWFLNGWRACPIRDAEAMGAAYEMLLHGQAHKSAIFLSRWAAIAGKTVSVTCASVSPPRLQVDDSFVVVRGERNFITF